jgi:hypothetical protein
METIGTWWMWAGFLAIVLVMLAIDLFVGGGGKQHKVSFKEAATWSVVWVSVSFLFAAALWWHLDGSAGREVANQKSLEFVTGYLIEKSLAIDNVFVWLMLFSFFGIPLELQKRVLVLGVLGAIVIAHGDDLRRRLADHPVPLDALPLRRLPAGHRHQDVVVRRGKARHGEQPADPLAARPHEDQPTNSTARSSSSGRTASATPRPCS